MRQFFQGLDLKAAGFLSLVLIFIIVSIITAFTSLLDGVQYSNIVLGVIASITSAMMNSSYNTRKFYEKQVVKGNNGEVKPRGI